ncbi:unnamed protein product [Ectocarpus sp. 8 AP-2014]
MIRKEKTHLSKFRARAKELEAHGVDTEALLAGMKEDKAPTAPAAPSSRFAAAAAATPPSDGGGGEASSRPGTSAAASPTATADGSAGGAAGGTGSDGSGVGGSGRGASSREDEKPVGVVGGAVAAGSSDSKKKTTKELLSSKTSSDTGKEGSRSPAAAAAAAATTGGGVPTKKVVASSATAGAKPSATATGGCGESNGFPASPPSTGAAATEASTAAGGALTSAAAGEKDGASSEEGGAAAAGAPAPPLAATGACAPPRPSLAIMTTSTASALAAPALAVEVPSSGEDGARGGRANSNPVGGGVRFIQRDLEAAQLMVRARKLDLAAREWVGLRCLLLRRATAAAAAAAPVPPSLRGGSTLVLRPAAVVREASKDGGGADNAADNDGETNNNNNNKTGKPKSAAKSNNNNNNNNASSFPKAAAAVRRSWSKELDAALQASPEDAGLVVESPQEAVPPGGGCVEEARVGWGGWGSGGDEKRYLAQAHTQEFLAHMSAMGRQEWGAASASAACVVRGVSAVLSGRCTNALCLLENPGRNAPSGGYSVGHGCGVPKLKEGACCSVNSVAVGALYAHMQWSVGRVAVVDFGTHLATGTADILCRTLDPAFLYATVAVSDAATATTGVGAHEHALRLLSTGASSSSSSSAQQQQHQRLTRVALGGSSGGGGGGAVAVLSAALEAFRPDLVMISAGLDGRKGEPCGRGDLVAEDFEWLTLEVRAEGRESLCLLVWAGMRVCGKTQR